MKIVILLMSMFIFGFANYITVVDNHISVTIDGKEYKYKIGKYPLPRDSIQLCYISGTGKALINGDYNRSLASNSSFSCYQLPQEKGFSFQKIIDKFNKVYHAEIVDINPRVRSAVGKRNIQLLTQLTGEIEVEKNISYLIIKSKEFGSPPVQLNLKDKVEHIKVSYENVDNNVSVFIIDVKDIVNQDLIEVTNRNGDVLLKRKILLIQ